MRDLMPIERFPVAKQAEIAHLVAQPSPPPKWLRLELSEIRSRAWTEWYRQRGIDPDRMREKIPREMRRQVIARDGLVCQICGGAVHAEDVHIDHLLPVVYGGANALANLQVAHAFCNLSKGART